MWTDTQRHSLTVDAVSLGRAKAGRAVGSVEGGCAELLRRASVRGMWEGTATAFRLQVLYGCRLGFSVSGSLLLIVPTVMLCMEKD